MKRVRHRRKRRLQNQTSHGSPPLRVSHPRRERGLSTRRMRRHETLPFVHRISASSDLMEHDCRVQVPDVEDDARIGAGWGAVSGPRRSSPTSPGAGRRCAGRDGASTSSSSTSCSPGRRLRVCRACVRTACRCRSSCTAAIPSTTASGASTRAPNDHPTKPFSLAEFASLACALFMRIAAPSSAHQCLKDQRAPARPGHAGWRRTAICHDRLSSRRDRPVQGLIRRPEQVLSPPLLDEPWVWAAAATSSRSASAPCARRSSRPRRACARSSQCTGTGSRLTRHAACESAPPR